ncbi:MAG: hypothetical protein NVSMB44_01550 [Ktedonobacteraceae bacterium]
MRKGLSHSEKIWDEPLNRGAQGLESSVSENLNPHLISVNKRLM